ncbi:Outer membrane receptor protein mostly Fe transport-like protein [Shewanella sediminis HAW-EB3]|uniref:Outer membrane receptor protein mostly Fe transport-like protein n=1 Tax=Shewanella sediminis (strain HAW-EB3) TaxID=425104 RepID=A8FS98_SHESH|nr:TonB-dependent receptor [Shewanella sediminis]ABV35721.1 Outer membrane receptor protein mostly Fe transport-like protein [Shewanella sediminis HAW-EB3]
MRSDYQHLCSSKMLKRSKIAQAVLFAISIAPITLQAEEAEPPSADTDSSSLEVITVTAQKRVQNIMKVPVTVGTVSESTIKESSSILLSDLDKFIPGFDFSDANMTQGGVTMRGISSPNISVGGDPSSAVFFDDVYMPRAAQNVIFSDMERIEVLKGPQGTLFGRNAAMGVVNMVPKKPISDLEGFVKGSYGTDNLQRYEGMINVPLSETFFIRANFLANAQDGIVENVADPSWNQNSKIWDLGERDHKAARLSMLWKIADSTNLQLSYDWDDLEQGPPMAIGISEYAYNGGKTPFADKAENDVKNGVEARDMYALTAKLNHDFNNEWSMKYILSYRDWETVNREDEDGTADITRYFDTSNNEDSSIIYSELQLNYIGGRVNAVAGFSYSKEDVNQRTELNLTADTAARMITSELNEQIGGIMSGQLEAMLGGNTDAHAEAAFGPGTTFAGVVDSIYSSSGFPMDHLWNANEWANVLNVLEFPGSPYSPEMVEATGDMTYDAVSMAMGIPEIFGPSFAGQWWQENIYNSGDFTNWGVFADVDYALTDKWNIIGGLRYSKDQKEFSWYIPKTTFAQVREGVSNILFDEVDMSSSDSWDEITGRLVTSYQLTDRHMVFASYSTGYKSGGYDSLQPSTESFAPENTTNYEAGYKGIISDSLIANISAYYLEVDGLQTTVSSQRPDSTTAVPLIINLDKEITGVELDLRWMATDNLTLGVVSEVRATDTYNPEFYNSVGELVPAETRSEDPALNYTLTLDWMPDFGVGTTNLHLDYQFVENTNADEVGLEDYKKAIPEYFKDMKNLSARLSWTDDSESLEIGLWGRNLLDERYMESLGGLAVDYLGTPHGRVNRGLETGIDLQYTF